MLITRLRDIAAAAVLVAQPVQAGDVSTEMVTQTGEFLATAATCRNVMDYLDDLGQGNQTDLESVVGNLVLMYVYGYAKAQGLSRGDAIDAVFEHCERDPSLPFAGFPVYLPQD